MNKCKICQELLIKRVEKIEKPGWFCKARHCKDRSAMDTKYCQNHMSLGWKSRDDDDCYLYNVVYYCGKGCDSNEI